MSRIPEVDHSVSIPLSIPTIWIKRSRRSRKKFSVRTRRKLPNLNAVEGIVCFFFNASTVVQNLLDMDIYFIAYHPYSLSVKSRLTLLFEIYKGFNRSACLAWNFKLGKKITRHYNFMLVAFSCILIL